MKQTWIVAVMILAVVAAGFMYASSYSIVAQKEAELERLQAEGRSLKDQVAHIKAIAAEFDLEKEQSSSLITSYFRSCHTAQDLPRTLEFDWILVKNVQPADGQVVFWLPKGKHVLTIQIEDSMKPGDIVSKEYPLRGETGYCVKFPQLRQDADLNSQPASDGLLMIIESNRDEVIKVEDCFDVVFDKPKSHSYSHPAPWRLKNQIRLDWMKKITGTELLEQARSLGSLIADYKVGWGLQQFPHLEFRFYIRSDGPVCASPQDTRELAARRLPIKLKAAGDHYESIP